MTETDTSGFTAEENAAWAEMSGEKPVEAAPPPVEEPDIEDDEAEDEAPVAKADPAKPPPQMVPHKALHRERVRRQEVESELQKQREWRAVMEDRWATIQRLQEAEQAPKVEEDAEPDPNQDIFAHNAWLRRQFGKMQEAQTTRETAEREQREAAEYDRAIWGRWNTDKASYGAENEHFGAAADYLAGVRAKQLTAFGYNQQQINAEIDRDLAKVVQHAAQSGKNAAEVIYKIAEANGFVPKAAEPTPAPAASAVPAMPEKLAQTAKAKEASVSLSQAGGKSAPAEMTLEDLAAMPMDEFAAWNAKKGNDKLFRKLMGG